MTNQVHNIERETQKQESMFKAQGFKGSEVWGLLNAHSHSSVHHSSLSTQCYLHLQEKNITFVVMSKCRIDTFFWLTPIEKRGEVLHC